MIAKHLRAPVRALFLMLSITAMGVAPCPAIVAQESDQDLDQEHVTLAFADTDIRDALRMVAAQSSVNIVISNEVSGSLTLDLEGVTLTEALDAIVSIGGFRYSLENNIATVQTLTEALERRRQQDEFDSLREEEVPGVPIEAMVLELRYVDAERIEPIVVSMLSPEGSVSILRTSDHVAQERGQVQGATDENGLQIGTRLTTSTVGEPAKSHTLVVLDTPARLAAVRRVVTDIDVKPQQVVIEARFVEVALDSEQKLGIDWNVMARASGAGVPHTGPFGSSSLGGISPDVAGGSSNGVFPSAPGSVSTPTNPGLFTFGTLDFTAFTALLEAIERETDVRLVSNPSIVVRDRHTATILVGERYPILSANVSEFGTVTEQLDRYEPIGVQLAVTPSITGDEVELIVRPSTSSLGADVEGSTGLAVARINSRQIDTLVNVSDGQTVVVGGLITTRDSDTESRVPLLGSLPLLGGLFRHTSRTQERVDLVVFLTVNIVQENGLTEEQRRMFRESLPDASAELPPLAERRSLEYQPSLPQF